MKIIETEFLNEQDEALPDNIHSLIENCFLKALELEGYQDKFEVSLTFAVDDYVRKLNREFRNNDSVTDVLSFPLGENGSYDENPETGRLMLGDIVIAVGRAKKQAEEYNHSYERELCFLAVHSFFHLLGYDHEAGKAEESEMFAKQESVLNALGISR